MSAETFTTALFLITAIIAAGVLINAVFPVIYTMSGTFSSATHESDQRLRTDIKIIATFAKDDGSTQIWIKNIGTAPISATQFASSDVFFGPMGDYARLSYSATAPAPGVWYPNLIDSNSNDRWDTGETLEIQAETTQTLSSGEPVYFQFVMPNGVWRSVEFTVS